MNIQPLQKCQELVNIISHHPLMHLVNILILDLEVQNLKNGILQEVDDLDIDNKFEYIAKEILQNE